MTIKIKLRVAVLTCKVLIGPHDLFRENRKTLSASFHTLPGFTFIKTRIIKKMGVGVGVRVNRLLFLLQTIITLAFENPLSVNL